MPARGWHQRLRLHGSYRSMEEALEKIPRPLPDVVLSDIGLPGISGIEGVAPLKQRFPICWC